MRAGKKRLRLRAQRLNKAFKALKTGQQLRVRIAVGETYEALHAKAGGRDERELFRMQKTAHERFAFKAEGADIREDVERALRLVKGQAHLAQTAACLLYTSRADDADL